MMRKGTRCWPAPTGCWSSPTPTRARSCRPSRSAQGPTGASSTPDTTNPTVTSYTPPSGSTQAPNATITLNINKPMNPASFVSNGTSQYQDSFAVVSVLNGIQTSVAGSVSVANTPTGSVVVFTPASPLTSGAQITAYISYWVVATDFAGNALSSAAWSFTVSGAADTTPPAVTSITPSGGAAGVGQNTPIVITFSKPLNPNTINNNTFGSAPIVVSSISIKAPGRGTANRDKTLNCLCG